MEREFDPQSAAPSSDAPVETEAWRGLDGESYVESLRSGTRLDDSVPR